MLDSTASPSRVILIAAGLLLGSSVLAAELPECSPSSYRRFEVVDEDDQVSKIDPVAADPQPRWAADASQQPHDWQPLDPDRAHFAGPIPFVLPPEEASGEPFYNHNHQPDITWLPNGDLLAIWYSTERESGTELTVLASRLRAGRDQWDPSAEFFKAEERNMHGNSVFYDDETGILHHINGMGRKGATGWANLALLHRYSRDNGVTWSVARPISSGANYQLRHQVIAGMVRTSDGSLIQPCDATPGGQGPTAIHVSRDGGRTWSDPGGDIRGIHAGVEELENGRLLAFGRGQAIEDRMPMSISQDMGQTWEYLASPFPVIGSGQRLVLRRLQEGPLLFVSFTGQRNDTTGIPFADQAGNEFEGIGMFAALSYDEGETWPVRKLLTPGEGRYDGGAHHRWFVATPTRAEHGGYLAATQSPDGVVHLISSRLHYQFNLKWLETPSPAVP